MQLAGAAAVVPVGHVHADRPDAGVDADGGGFNPVNWAVEAGRAATTSGTDWSFVAVRLGGLAALALIATMFATRAFRSYQRSV